MKARNCSGGGAHPNFDENSSQRLDKDKNLYEDIFNYFNDFLPGAKIFRSHRYFSVNDSNDLAYKIGYKYSSNTCTNLQLLEPFRHRSGLIEFPVFFEDGSYLYNENPLNLDFFKEKLLAQEEKAETSLPIVINFHPMHLMLNTPHFQYTRDIKDRLSREEWNNLNAETIAEISYKGYGISNLIQEIIEYAKGFEVKHLLDVAEEYAEVVDCVNGV